MVGLVKYIGPDMGATGPQNGGVYPVTAIAQRFGKTRISIIDENADRESYLYDPLAPTLSGSSSPGGLYSGGKFYIVEDGASGELAALGLTHEPD